MMPWMKLSTAPVKPYYGGRPKRYRSARQAEYAAGALERRYPFYETQVEPPQYPGGFYHVEYRKRQEEEEEENDR